MFPMVRKDVPFEQRADYPWRQFIVLFAAGMLGALAVIPYQLALLPPDTSGKVPPLPLLISLPLINSAVQVAVAVGIGLLAARAVGLHAPLSEAIALRGDVRSAIRQLDVVRAALLGIAATVLVLLLDATVFQSVSASFAQSGVTAPSRVVGFLASFEGGITEEILLRLLVMSVLVWLIMRVRPPSPTVFWIANAAAAVLFGLGHLPATAVLIPLTPLVVARAIVLNGLLGVVAGWLYWRRGLESAMVAHFSGDVVLHVILGG
jgi:hypothetical protein